PSATNTEASIGRAILRIMVGSTPVSAVSYGREVAGITYSLSASLRPRIGGVRGLPPAASPFRQVGACGAHGRIRTVTGVDHRVTGVAVENALLDVVEQLGEGLLRGRLADAAGEQRVADEQVRRAVALVERQAHAAAGVAAKDEGHEVDVVAEGH